MLYYANIDLYVCMITLNVELSNQSLSLSFFKKMRILVLSQIAMMGYHKIFPVRYKVSSG